MRPSDFKRWRKALKLSQKQAAEALGLKRRMVQYYEKGERDGEKVAVPKAIRLACYALTSGIADYHGPEGKEDTARHEVEANSAALRDPQQQNHRNQRSE